MVDEVYFSVRLSKSRSSEWSESNEWPKGKQVEGGFINNNEKNGYERPGYSSLHENSVMMLTTNLNEVLGLIMH